jgi:hypothetical protein
MTGPACPKGLRPVAARTCTDGRDDVRLTVSATGRCAIGGHGT